MNVACDKLTKPFMKYAQVQFLNSFQNGTLWLDLNFIVRYNGP